MPSIRRDLRCGGHGAAGHDLEFAIRMNDTMAQSRLRHFRCYAVLFCALVQGCVTPPPEPAPPPREPVVSQVPDGDWELVTSTFIGTGRIPGVPRATLAFKDGRMSAFSGCNRAGAAARLVDDWLEVGAMATTRRACPEPIGSFESRFFKLLGARPVFRVDGDTLTLVAGSQNARLRRTGSNSAQDAR
jgi:heat shock protein HslJ